MKPSRPIAFAFGFVLLIGGLVFLYQTRELDKLQTRLPGASGAAPSSHAADAPPPAVPNPRPDHSLPRDSGVPTEAFLNKVKEKLLAKLSPADLLKFFDYYQADFERMAASAKLGPEERKAFSQGLEKFDLQVVSLFLNPSLTPAERGAEISRLRNQKEEWLAAQLGPEREAEHRLMEDKYQRDSAEEKATAAVSRLSATTNLSEQQKGQLHTAFVERLLNEGSATEQVLAVATRGKVNTEPPVPDVWEEARLILTPEQLQLFQERRDLADLLQSRRSKAMADFMNSLLPAIGDALSGEP